MKRIVLMTALLLLSASWVMAQTSSSSAATDTGQNSNQTSIQGCLSGSAGNYTLTDQTGKTYQIAGDTSTLSGHEGQEVQLTGKEMAGTSASTTNPSSGSSGSVASGSSSRSSASGSSSQAQFEMSKVKKVSDTCNNPSSK